MTTVRHLTEKLSLLLLSFAFTAGTLVSCTDDTFERIPTPAPLPAKAYTFSETPVDLRVLEQLRKDTVFRMMVEAMDIAPNLRIIDSLNGLTGDPSRLDSLRADAVGKREAPYIAAYRAGRDKYPRDLFRYTAYECGIRYREFSAAHPRTRSADRQARDLIVDGSAGYREILARELERLRVMLRSEFSLKYSKWVYEHCDLIHEEEIIRTGLEVATQAAMNVDITFLRGCAECSRGLATPVCLSSVEASSTLHNYVYNGYLPGLPDEMMNWVRYYFDFDVYRDYFTYDLSCHCIPKCGRGSGGTGGGTGGGGGSQVTIPSPSGTPVTNKVFDIQGSFLQESMWVKLEESLNVLNRDPVGLKLLEKLKDKHIKIINNTAMSSGGGYDHSTNTITIRDFGLANPQSTNFQRILMHEMLHAAQVPITGDNINREIEVRVAIARYEQRNSITITNKNEIGLAIDELSKTMDKQYNITDETGWKTQYQEVVNALKNDPNLPYKDMPESENYRNFNTIKELSAGLK